MSKLQLVGFVGVCAIAGVGVDYHQQSKSVDGWLSLSGYQHTITGRFNGFKAEQAAAKAEKDRQKRWKAGGKISLPEAPEGWVRRNLTEGNNDAVLAANASSDALRTPSAAAKPIAADLNKASAEKMAREADGRGWVYENDKEIIWVDVIMKTEAQQNSLAGLIGQTIAGMTDEPRKTRGLGVIGGVAFVEDLGSAFDLVVDRQQSKGKEAPQPDPFRKIAGKIGLDEEIIIRVNAVASDESIRAILTGIDYDSLNAMLQIPVQTIGNDVSVPMDLEQEIALEMATLHSEFVGLQAEMAQQKMNNLNGAALVMNTLAMNYGVKDGLTDLTGRKVKDMRGALQMGYRAGLRQIMDAQHASADTDAGAPAVARASGDSGGGMVSGLFSSITSVFSGGEKSGGGRSGGTPNIGAKVTVNKGGHGGSKCAMQGSIKRCTGG